MTYYEKLQHPKWQKKRLEILARDNFSCQHCNSKETSLHIHHFSYAKNPWETPDVDLITLCDRCHKEYSYKDKAIKELNSFLKRNLGINDIMNLYENMSGLKSVLERVKELRPSSFSCANFWELTDFTETSKFHDEDF